MAEYAYKTHLFILEQHAWEWQYLEFILPSDELSGAYVNDFSLVPLFDLGRFRFTDGNGNENNQMDIGEFWLGS